MLKKIVLVLVFSFSSIVAKTLYLDEVPIGQADPAKYSDKADKIIIFNAYDTLVTEKAGSNGEMIGSLASSWKVSGKSYIFELKKNTLFHSGNELTSEDVVYSYQRFIKINQGFAYLFSGWVKDVKSLGKYKVQFTLEKNYAPFLSSLIHLAIVDKKTILAKGKSDDGQQYLSKNSAGTGAYKIESHNPQKSTVFVQNKKYFQFIDKNAPTKIILKYGLKEATVRSLMTRGKHSLSSTWLPPEVFRSLSKNKKIKLLTNSGSSLFFIKLNTQKPPLDDKNCRKALAYALDYNSLMSLNKITNSVFAAKSANGPIPQGMLGYKDLKPYKQDMRKAKSFLKKCKYKPSNFELEISWIAEVPLEERFALLMAKNYKSLGFKTKVVKVPWALFTQKVTKVKSTPHISQIFSPSATPDPDTLLYNTYHSSFQGTWMAAEWLNDKTTDRLLDQARSEKSQSKRRVFYEKLVEHLRELQPSIFAYEEVEVYAARKNVDIPAFSNLKNSFSTDTLGLSFRFMKVK